MSRPAKPKPRQKKVNGYKMPEPIPQGFVLKDGPRKNEWQIGTSIGKGGFGEIYCAALVDESEPASKKKTKSNAYPYVIKIEPQENGPLFVEMHFYIKVAKQEDLDEWIKTKKLKSLGMPSYLGSGSFDYSGEKYRFLVMDRYGQDLWSIFTENKAFPLATTLQIGMQIIDVLEYIHSKGYAHCDVKGSNLVLGLKPGTENQVYLVDFGLASRYSINKDYKPDPKNAHNGTIEYTSRDLHQGVITCRGDMEVLCFNMLHWVNSSLPWEKDIADAKAVEAKKKELMNSVSKSTYVKQNLSQTPSVILKLLSYVAGLKHNEAPDYEFCIQLFKTELKNLGHSETDKLNFKISNKKETKTKKVSKVKESPRKKAKKDEVNGHMSTEEEEEELPNITRRKPTKKKADAVSWKNCPTAVASKVVRAGEYSGKSENGDGDIGKKPKVAKRPQRKVKVREEEPSLN